MDGNKVILPENNGEDIHEDELTEEMIANLSNNKGDD